MGRHDAKGLQRLTGAKTGGKPGGGTSAVADLQLMLHDRQLLVVCAIAFLAPFAVYFAVITMTGNFDDWALFIFAPMITVGMLIGAMLDRAYAQGQHE